MYQLWDNNFSGFLYSFFFLSLPFVGIHEHLGYAYIIEADDPSSGTRFHSRED